MADTSELAARVMHTGRAFGRILAVPAVPARRLTIVIALCAGYGVLTQALFFGVDTGLSWLFFIAGSGLLVLRAFGERTWLGIFWFIAALWAATAYVVYASDWSAYTAAPLSVGLILSLPLVVGRRLKVQELAMLPASATRVVREFPRAVRRACDLPTLLARGEARQELRRAFVGVLLGLPLSGAFIALLCADERFSSLMSNTVTRSLNAAHFTALSFLGAVAYIIAYFSYRNAMLPEPEARHKQASEFLEPPPLAPDAAHVSNPYRSRAAASPAAPATRRWQPSLRTTTWAIILAQLVIVFAAFGAVNLPHLFQDHDFLRRTGTTTYAKHLHAGFYQLSFAALLSVMVVVAGHRLLHRSKEAPSRQLAVGVLEVTLLGLTVVLLLSCWQRLELYQAAYGASYLRLAVMFFQIGVLLLLALTAFKSARPAWRGYGSGVVLTLLLLGLGAASFDADAYIASRNVERLSRTDISTVPLDVAYLAALSDDALPVLNAPYFRRSESARIVLAVALCSRIDLRNSQDWRAWRGLSGWRATKAGLCDLPELDPVAATTPERYGN